MTRKLTILICAATALIFAPSLPAMECYWTGEAGDGKWSNPGNWSTRIPKNGESDSVYLNGNGLVDGAMENDIGELSVYSLRITGATPLVLNSAYEISILSTGNYGLNIAPSCTINGNIRKVSAGSFYFGSNFTLNGALTIDGEVVLSIYGAANIELQFNGAVDGHEATLVPRAQSGCSVRFYGKVSLAELDSGRGYYQCEPFFYASGNEIGTISHAYYRVSLEAENALSRDTLITWDRYYTQNGDNSAVYRLNGAQQADRIQNDPLPADKTNIEHIRAKSAGASLTLYGSADAVCYANIADDVSVIWNPEGDFTQEFRDRANSTHGSLSVSNGTLRVAGTATFANVPSIAVGGGLFEVTSTVKAFAALRSLAVASGGVFRVLGNVEHFTAKSVAVDIDANGTVSLPDNFIWAVASLTIGGVAQGPGVYGQDVPQIAGGGVIVVADANPVEVPTAMATWDGGASDNLASRDANWVADAAPDFMIGGLVATFAAAGSRAEFAGGEILKGVVLDSAGDFEIAAPSAVHLRQSGVSAAGPSRTYTLSSPFVLDCAQTWTNAATTTVNVGGGIRQYDVSASLTIKGPGSGFSVANRANYNFSGTNFVAGGISITDAAVVTLSGTATAPCVVDGVAPITVTANAGGLLWLDNAIVHKPLEVNFSSGDNNQLQFTTRPNSTNHIYGAVKITGSTPRIKLFVGSELHFENGLTSQKWLLIDGEGKCLFRNKPVVLNTANEPFRLDQSGVEVCFEAEGNVLQRLDMAAQNVKVHFGCDGAIGDGETPIRLKDVASDALVDLGGYSQQIGSLEFENGTAKGQCIHSDAPAMLNFIQTSDATLSNVDVTGCAGLGKYGFATFTVSRAVSSLGDVKVGAGELAFSVSGSWRKGTNVYVEASGTLSVAASRAFGKQAVFHVTTGGGATVRLANGADQHISELWVDGVKQRDGTYGGTGSSAANKPTWFSSVGSGTLVVGKSGFCVVVF